jgi:hypothetical protein
MVTRAVAAGWRVVEVDVDYLPRTGKSKVTGTVGGTLKAGARHVAGAAGDRVRAQLLVPRPSSRSPAG